MKELRTVTHKISGATAKVIETREQLIEIYREASGYNTDAAEEEYFKIIEEYPEDRVSLFFGWHENPNTVHKLPKLSHIMKKVFEEDYK